MKEAAPTVPRAGTEIKFTERQIKNFWRKVDKVNGPLPDQTNPHYAGLDRCWVWTGCKIKSGYGRVRLERKLFLTHRIAWMIENGPIPYDGSTHGVCALHKCDRRDCTNPSHLFLGRIADNVADMLLKGRNNPQRGNKNGARLHPERLARGDANGSRLYPERLTRGDANGSRLYPERLMRGEDNNKAKLTSDEVLEARAMHATKRFTHAMIALHFGVNRSTISNILRRKTWAHLPDEWV